MSLTDGIKRLGIAVFLLLVVLRALAQPVWLTQQARRLCAEAAPDTVHVGTIVLDNLARLNIRELEIHNQGEPLILIDEAILTPHWTDLIRGNLALRDVHAKAVHVRLVRTREGISHWSDLARRLRRQAEPRGEGTEALDLQMAGGLSVNHADLVIETPRCEAFHFHNIQTAGKLYVDGRNLSLNAQAKGPGIALTEVALALSPEKFTVLIDSPQQDYNPHLRHSLPPNIREVLDDWMPEGSAEVFYSVTVTLPQIDSNQELIIRPRQLAITPPGFLAACHIRSGRLTLDPKSRDLTLEELNFDVGNSEAPPVAVGSVEGRGREIRISARLRPGTELSAALPPRLRRILDYVGPSAPFTAEWFKNALGSSLEARFENLDFTGLTPSLRKATGVVTCDFPDNQPMKGRASFSRLTCLNIPFTWVDVPFLDNKGFRLGTPEPFIAVGPWAHISGSFVAQNGRLQGSAEVRGIDVRQWIRTLDVPEDLADLNGALGGTLTLNVPEGASHDSEIGTFKFFLHKADMVVSNRWLPLARLLRRPQDLLSLPLKALGGRSAKDFSEQRLRSAEGTLTLNPNKLFVDAFIEGDPFNFQVNGRVRFSNRGELNFKPVLLTRYDPIVLLMDLVPIPIVWPQEASSP